jgi:hypothetical protein
VSGCGGNLLRWNVADVLRDVPAVTIWVGQLPVALAPELLLQGVLDFGPRVERLLPRDLASSVEICSTVAVPPIESGDSIPASGNSLAMWTGESPIRISTVITVPPGSGTRVISCAPNARAYQLAAALASVATMWAVTFIAVMLADSGCARDAVSGERTVVVEPQELDDVAHVGFVLDPPRSGADPPWKYRMLGDPALFPELGPNVLREAEVGGVVAVQMAKLAASNSERDRCAPTSGAHMYFRPRANLVDDLMTWVRGNAQWLLLDLARGPRPRRRLQVQVSFKSRSAASPAM